MTIQVPNPTQEIASTLDDGRKVKVQFQEKDGMTGVRESFEIEDVKSVDLQRAGWQAILDNFKKHAEAQK
ncbi:MAG: hypothetical protein ACO1OQ_03935 [Rufibacter sp.]